MIFENGGKCLDATPRSNHTPEQVHTQNQVELLAQVNYPSFGQK